jgi:hypothetical protein
MNLLLSSFAPEQSTTSLLTPRPLGLSVPDFAQEAPTALASPEQMSHSSNVSPRDINEVPQINAIDYAGELWNMETFWEDYLRPLPMTPLNQDLMADGSNMVPEISRDREDEVERIAYLFHQQTCHTLSIEEETDHNPWKTLIWPLAKEYPALYHAIAALTCFGMSKQQPQLRNEGVRHVNRSTQLLSENVEQGEIPLDAALAATLALGFAETWDNEASSTGSNHIRGGGILLQKIRSNQVNTVFSVEEAARLDFLAHTWMYMDVLARFTSSDLSQPYSGSTSDVDLLDFEQDPSRLDPLMGYSTTFFPIMRRVADLINAVKARSAPRNSPALISRAIELRRSIEHWTLPVSLETIDDPSQLKTDAIQTAEAYRYSTLIMLYQAVPELPNLTSYGELAQKVLVYLATIPLSSRTLITHIFPLMVAGCDAVEEEDRQFVRERWLAMAARMVTGIADRCLRITEEIWKRREVYLLERGLAFTASGRQISVSSTLNEAAALSKDIASFINFGTSPGAHTEGFGRKGNDFPISAAFKKGVDVLTRSGSTEYTVRGRLHWLGVMRDWEWQGRFEFFFVSMMWMACANGLCSYAGVRGGESRKSKFGIQMNERVNFSRLARLFEV